MNKEKCQQAFDLRAQGLSYKAIGDALQVSEDYARQMVLVNDILQTRQELWTHGLPPRVGRVIRNAGFESCQQLQHALQHEPQRLLECPGLGPVGLQHLRTWLQGK